MTVDAYGLTEDVKQKIQSFEYYVMVRITGDNSYEYMGTDYTTPGLRSQISFTNNCVLQQDQVLRYLESHIDKADQFVVYTSGDKTWTPGMLMLDQSKLAMSGGRYMLAIVTVDGDEWLIPDAKGNWQKHTSREWARYNWLNRERLDRAKEYCKSIDQPYQVIELSDYWSPEEPKATESVQAPPTQKMIDKGLPVYCGGTVKILARAEQQLQKHFNINVKLPGMDRTEEYYVNQCDGETFTAVGKSDVVTGKFVNGPDGDPDAGWRVFSFIAKQDFNGGA